MRILYIILGCLCTFLGLIGILIPLLPTTPLLLLAAALFFRSSKKLHHWLTRQPMIGQYIKDFREHKKVPAHAKIVSILLLWMSITTSIFFVEKPIWVNALLIVILVGVTIHILSFKSS